MYRPARSVFAQAMLMLFAFMSMSATALEFPAIFEAEHTAVLSSERAGVVAKLTVKEGDTVKKGALLMRLDSGELELNLQQKQLSQNFLSQRVATLRDLVRDGIAPSDELAEVVMQRDVNAAEIQLLRHYIEHSELKAPFAGRVSARLVQQHEWVKQGQEVVALVNPQQLRLSSNLPAPLAVQLQPGTKRKVRVAAIDGELEVSLLVVLPQVEVQSNTVRVLWTLITPSAKLVSGMKAALIID